MKTIAALGFFVIFVSVFGSAQDKSSYCQATFKYYNGVGEFVIGDEVTALSLGPASAGYAFTSNDELFTTMQDFGAIPIGQYRISVYTGTKFKGVPNVFDLTPMPGTNTLGRSDFKIHGKGLTKDKKVKTAAESSNGCIILEPTQREKLKKYFDTCGKAIILSVKNNR